MLKKLTYRILTLIVISLALTACATPPKQKTITLETTEPLASLEKRLHMMALKCWERDVRLLGDGVNVILYSTPEGSLLTGQRYASDIGYMPPFIEVKINQTHNISYVEIWEGGDTNPFSENFLSKEITSWVTNSKVCLTDKKAASFL